MLESSSSTHLINDRISNELSSNRDPNNSSAFLIISVFYDSSFFKNTKDGKRVTSEKGPARTKEGNKIK